MKSTDGSMWQSQREQSVSRKEGKLPLPSQANKLKHTHTLLPQLDHRSQSQQCSLQPFYSYVLYVQMCATGEAVRPFKIAESLG